MGLRDYRPADDEPLQADNVGRCCHTCAHWDSQLKCQRFGFRALSYYICADWARDEVRYGPLPAGDAAVPAP